MPGGHARAVPDCIPNVCPKGTFGRYPNCVKLPPIGKVCPPGTHGTPPRCVKDVCPKGTIGRYPNCVKQPTLGINPNLKLLVPPTRPTIR